MISVKVEFNDSFFKKTNPQNYIKAADTAIFKTILEGESICKKEAPIKGGDSFPHPGHPYSKGVLRRSISSSHDSIMSSSLRSSVKYWGYVQDGTSKMEPNPFVTRTFNKIRSKNLINKYMGAELKHMGII